jgi:hypothetical protein
LSLNKGYQSRFNEKKYIGVQHNLPGAPIDFDVTKYIKPYNNKEQPYLKIQEEVLAEKY